MISRLIFALSLAILCISVLATPIQSYKRSFKVPRLAVEGYVPHGPRALQRARAKYGVSQTYAGPASIHKRELTVTFGDDITVIPESPIANSISRATNGTAATNENGETPATGTNNDAQFLSPIQVGGQTMIVNFDSGSSDTWIFNTRLPASQQQGHTIYDPTKSSTAKLIQGSTFNISYGDGSTASGVVGTDTVDIGGATVPNQAVGLPERLSTSFVSDSASNGLVGLAFGKLNTMKPVRQKTFFDNVLPNLSQPVFTAALKGDGQNGGSYEFGKVDTTSFRGELNVIKIDSGRGFWEFASTTASVNGQSISIPGARAIADTGTSLMLVGDTLLKGYWSQVPGATTNAGAGGVVFPCNAQLPDLQIAIGAKTATVEGKNFNFAPVGRDSATGERRKFTDPNSSNAKQLANQHANQSDTVCFGGMQSSAGLGFAIYGDVFFKSNFVVFEGVTPSLGFAPHA